MTPALISLLVLAGSDFSLVEETDGIRIESRPVAGSNIVELRLTTTTSKAPGPLCDAAFGEGKFDPEEPDLKSRKILSESADERVTYDQISPPVVANRDYAVRAKRIRTSDDLCVMTFTAANELAPPRPDGWVRITKLWGEWRFERVEGKTKVTYVVFSDPAGSIPAFMVEGSRRKMAVKWLKMIISRG
ncbi:MAG: START domain-containing protein [Myxococcota bacterium]